MKYGLPRGRLLKVVIFSLLAVPLVLLAPPATAQGAWEFRVCAHPYNYPASSRDQPGYENRIAEILADEMNATLTYEWIILNEENLTRTLHAGTCDAVIGIGESVGEVANTVPFLRAPYVFVTRAQDGQLVESLDDPELAQLRVGTYTIGVPSLALRRRGLTDNVREFAPVSSLGGYDFDTPILDALVGGEIDVAIIYAPAAAAREQQNPGSLTIMPVTPELDAGQTILQLFRIQTIGVRPNDIVFAQRLNAALANRWEDVQEAIDQYGVPQLSVQRPPPLPPGPESEARVGVVVPAATGDYSPYERVGELARLGMEVAIYDIARRPMGDVPFEVLLASAPTDEAAVRAARRLIATESAVALVGGLGSEQAERLAQTAMETGTLFFNIGDNDDRLRNEACNFWTFHVEASESMYVDAIIDWYSRGEPADWFILHYGTIDGSPLLDHAVSAIESTGAGQVVGSTAVFPGQIVFTTQVDEVAAAAPDIVLLLIGPEDQEQVLAQMSRRVDAAVAVVPDMRSQTREFLYRFRQAAPEYADNPRPALWEATLADAGAAALIETFAARTGDVMDPAAWAAYASIMFVYEAAAAGHAEPEEMAEFLEDPATRLGAAVGKGDSVSFRPWNHQLSQSIYMVTLDPQATWGRALGARLAVASTVGTVPESGPAQGEGSLELLGEGEQESTCRLPR